MPLDVSSPPGLSDLDFKVEMIAVDSSKLPGSTQVVGLLSLHQRTGAGEQRLLQSSQKHRADADTSVLRSEIELLEPKAEDASRVCPITLL